MKISFFLSAVIALFITQLSLYASQSSVLWHHSTSGAVKIMPIDSMNPSPSFSVVDSSNVNLVPGGMGDFTGDGQPDILFHNQNSGNLRIWKMDGTVKADNIQVLGSSNTNLKIAGIGDFDQDGDNDIATFNTNSGAMRIWVMDGIRRVDNVLVLTGANTNLVPRGVGDMNSDGIPDLVLRNNNSGAVRVWTMNSDFTRKGNEYVTGSSNTNLELRGVVDINGDSKNDILNYNTNTGKLRAWLMDGYLAITENVEITQDIDLKWSVRGGGDNIPTYQLILSSSEAVPGSFITIEDDSIKEGDELKVTFKNTFGYKVTIKTILTENGYAKVPVPPIVNLTTGDFTSSMVTVSIPFGGQTTLNILPLPELSGVTSGDVVKMYLSYTKSNLLGTLENMDQLSSEFSYNTSDLEQYINRQIISIETSINEIESLQQMSMYSFYDGQIILDQNDLGKLDQLLFAVLKGAMEEDLKGETEVSGIAASAKNLPSNTLDYDKTANWVYSDIKDSKIVLVGIGGMTVTVAGVLMAPGVAAGTTYLFAYQAAGASLLVVGTASEGLKGLEAFLNENKEHEFGNEYQKEGFDTLINLGLAAGSEKSGLINLGAFLYTTADVVESISNLICNKDPVPFGFEAYCKEWEDKHKPKELAIKILRFYDEVMLPGVEGELAFWLEGDKDAGRVSVEIDWGDGEGEVRSLIPMRQYSGTGDDAFDTKIPSMYHAFTLGTEDRRIYTIKIHAKDSNGNEAWANTEVLVTESMETRVTFSSIPTRIKTKKESSWGITINGVKPPYSYTMSWGDGSTTTGVFDTVGDFTLNHTYIMAKMYTVRMDVTDANKVSSSITSPADVRNPVSIASITGPTGLDVDETDTWTVILDGGWEPFTGSVMWMDFSETPFTSQTRQFTISHSYAEEGIFDFQVDLTDDEGDNTQTGVFTVEVPKAERSFPITLTITCNDPDTVIPIQNLTLTVNNDDTITLSKDGSDPRTTEISFNYFQFEWTTATPDGSWTEILNGSIDIDESTRVITGNGKYSASGVGDMSSLECSGTWTSN